MMIYEDIYHGNAAVMAKLLEAIDGGGLVAFTGAGSSMPDLPGWSSIVNTLVVAHALPNSVAGNAADIFGSRKLGQVFLALTESTEINSSIKKFFLFTLLIRSKPEGWLKKAKQIASNTNRDAIYLRHMLSISLSQFRNEINTESERQSIKELVASIRLRRDANVKAPSTTEIKRAIGKLDKGGYWDQSQKIAEE